MPSEEIEMPWSKRTPQESGRYDEKRMAKRYNARLHPNSGAGSIKHDASNDSTLIEFKQSQKSHTLNGAYLSEMLSRAHAQGKDALYTVEFLDAGVLAEITLKRLSN